MNLLVSGAVAAPVAALASRSPSVPQTADKAKSVFKKIVETGKIRCGFIPWPPFWDVDVITGEPKGMNRDIFDRLFQILDLKPEYVPVELGFHVNDLNNGKIDVVVGDGPWVISTIKHINYSSPYYYSPMYVYIRADEKRFATLESLNSPDATFVGIDGDTSTDLKDIRFPKAKIRTLSNLTDPALMLMEVVTGKADAVICDPVAGKMFIDHNPGKLKLLEDKPLAVYGGGVSVAKDESELLNTFNQGIEAALNIGMIDAIIDKYDPGQDMMLRVQNR